MVAYQGTTTSPPHCETIFELRLCKVYQLNATNLPTFTDNTNQVNQLQNGLGITIDRPTRIINFNGRIMAISHPAGINHPGSNATRPPSQLQHNQPFWLLKGVQPNLTPQHIIHAIRTHDQQQLDEATVTGTRPLPSLGLAIHLAVCNPCELDQRIMAEHQQPRTVDTWFLYPTAGTEVSQFPLSQALLSLGQGGRRPQLVVQPDDFFSRNIRTEASRNPISASHHVRRPYSYSDAVQRARVLDENARATPPLIEQSTHGLSLLPSQSSRSPLSQPSTRTLASAFPPLPNYTPPPTPPPLPLKVPL